MDSIGNECIFSTSLFPSCSPSLHSYPTDPNHLLPLEPSSPHSHNEAWQEFTNLQPMLIIPQAIVQNSINPILSEDCQFLHIIPFVDDTNQNEMQCKFREELSFLLGQELKAYPKEEITRIVSRFLEK
ncbi:hypothetical protein O181_016455 [Austropuccinia psidii MF-1]|uniref:Uncharacterized protein n=1 Tax=Austropuccinia psidii MF-1 TaxID=1389203 RepID=A0A9Q3GRZ8_9BASI|nr:hypothetical protein [Austropuccinia psidii MF-1]